MGKNTIYYGTIYNKMVFVWLLSLPKKIKKYYSKMVQHLLVGSLSQLNDSVKHSAGIRWYGSSVSGILPTSSLMIFSYFSTSAWTFGFSSGTGIASPLIIDEFG